jgi:hypothetical protein
MTTDDTLAAGRAFRAALARIAAEHPEMTTDEEERERSAAWLGDEETNAMVTDDRDQAHERVQTAVRIPRSMIARVDAYAEQTRR